MNTLFESYQHSGLESSSDTFYVWHVLIDGDQVGPLDPAELRTRFAAGELDSRSYVWREGLAEWQRVETVDELAALLPSSSAPAAPVLTAQRLTRQRNESSVLFSLTDLRDIGSVGAMPSAPMTSSSGSGLIDIRTMAAASTRPAESPPSLAVASSLGNGFSTAPVLLPAKRAGRPLWLLPTLLGGSGVALALTVTLGLVLIQRDGAPRLPSKVATTMALVPETTVPRTTAPTKITAVGQTVPVSKPDKVPDTANTAPTGHEAKPRTRETARRRALAKRTRRRIRRKRERQHRRKRSTVASNDRKTTDKRSDLDKLLDGALKKGETKVATVVRRPERKLPDRLERAQIVSGMRSVTCKVKACFARYRVPGMAMLRANIGKSGRVTTVKITSRFAGTPTGACVANAVKTARFPRTARSATISYAFFLR